MKTQAETQLKKVDFDASDVYLFVQPYLDIKATGYDTTKGTFFVDIQAMYRTVASSREDASQIALDGESVNAVVLENIDGVSGTLSAENVQVSIQLPSGFVSTTAPIYVLHKADVAGSDFTYTATFTTEGFSPLQV